MLGSLQSKAAASAPRTKPLLYLIYIQVISLVLTYAAGIWVTITVHNISFDLPDVLEHGLAASVFVLSTALVGFIAALQGQRKISIYNFALFLITVLTGSTGSCYSAIRQTQLNYDYEPIDVGKRNNWHADYRILAGQGLTHIERHGMGCFPNLVHDLHSLRGIIIDASCGSGNLFNSSVHFCSCDPHWVRCSHGGACPWRFGSINSRRV